MNQAQSRRLRTCYLLLPLLLASVPAVSWATTTGLEASSITSPVAAGVALSVTVTARSASGVDTGYNGTIRFSSTAPRALLPANYTFNPTVDRGTKTFLVTFQSLGQWELLVQDINSSQFYAQIPNITVTPGPLARFNILMLDPSVVAGSNYSFQVVPVDAADNRVPYSGTLHFETSTRSAQLPGDTAITIDAVQTPPQFPITFFSADPKATLTVSDARLGISGSASTAVRANQFDHVELSTTAPPLTPTCSEATITLTASDAWNNPVPQVPASTLVSLCVPADRSVSFVSTTLTAWDNSNHCVTGILATPTAQVVWKDEVEEDVAFTVENSSSSLTIHWKAGIPSPQNSNFSFRESASEPAPLALRSGQLTAELTLRDLCGNPATLPADKILSFGATPPLAITTPLEERPGRWTTTVTLPECPSAPSTSLAVWPLINNEVLKKPNGDQVQRLVLPQCSAIVKLSLVTPAESLVAGPGEMVEFEVQVSNESDLVLTGGVLMLEAGGLTVAGASVDGQALTAKGAGFELPELRSGSPLTVKVTAQATTQLKQTVSAKVWVVDPNGTALTGPQPVDFQQKDPKVNVGCVCHTASLPSQLLTWLALILVTSRPWGGLRRLRKGERIDH